MERLRRDALGMNHITIGPVILTAMGAAIIPDLQVS
jgi:hypothetical protein